MLRQLGILLTSSFDTKGLEKGESKINEVKDAAAGLGNLLAATVSFVAIKAAITSSIEFGAHLDDLSQRFGVSAQAISQWQYAALMSGIDAESAATSLGLFQRMLGKASKEGGPAAENFKKLGVDMAGVKSGAVSITDAAAQVADGLQQYGSETEKAGALTEAFGRNGGAILPMLKNGSAGLRAMAKEFETTGGAPTKGFIANAAAADDAMDRLGVTAKNVRNSLVTTLLPGITAATQSVVLLGGHISKFVNTHQSELIGGSQAAAFAIGGGLLVNTVRLSGAMPILAAGFFKAAAGLKEFMLMFQVLPAFSKLLFSVKGIVSAFSTLKTAAMAVGAAIAGPLLLAVAVAGAALVVQDLYVLMKGGDSVIGKWLDSFAGVGTAAATAESLRTAWDGVNESFGGTGSVFGSAMKFVSAAVRDIAEAIDTVITGLKLAGQEVALIGVGIQAAAASVLAAAGSKSEKEKLKYLLEKQAAIEKDQSDTRASLMDRREGKQQEFIDPNTGKVIGSARVGGYIGEKDIHAAAAKQGFANVSTPDEERIKGNEERRNAAGTAAAYVVRPGETKAPDITANTTQTNNIKIEVVGGEGNAETGAAVGAAVTDAMGKTALNNAAYAVPLGGKL